MNRTLELAWVKRVWMNSASQVDSKLFKKEVVGWLLCRFMACMSYRRIALCQCLEKKQLITAESWPRTLRVLEDKIFGIGI